MVYNRNYVDINNGTTQIIKFVKRKIRNTLHQHENEGLELTIDRDPM